MLNQPIDDQFERLIASGGDNRLLLGQLGLNQYGCGPNAHDRIQFGSCTCSSPSLSGLSVARQMHAELKNHSAPQAYASQQFEIIRDQIRHHLALPAGVDIALTPSGTDVEMLALAVTASHTQRPIVNLVVGPAEVGSGTKHAAGGLYFDSLVPAGRSVNVQQPVDTDLASRVTVCHVDVRNAAGRQLPLAEVDARVTEAVIDAANSGAHVIVHLVAHSKTGIYAPSLNSIASIKNTLKEDVTVVIDAAQGRLAIEAYKTLLEQQCMVSFTGSKFFGGPPFCGALLVPESLRPDSMQLNPLPESFGDYFNRDTLPKNWEHWRAQCSIWTNYGLLLRWTAAATEMAAFYEIEAGIREVIFSTFANEVTNSSLASERSVVVSIKNDPEQTLTPISAYQSVFSFEVRNLHDQLLDKKQLKELHHRINTDLQHGFLLGQPVQIGRFRSVLRIALGAPLVVAVANDQSLGRTLDHRLTWLREKIRSCFKAIDSLVVTDRQFTAAALSEDSAR